MEDSRRSIELTSTFAAYPISSRILSVQSDNQATNSHSTSHSTREDIETTRARAEMDIKQETSSKSVREHAAQGNLPFRQLSLSPLDNLPRVIKDMLLAQSPVPTDMSAAQKSLIAAADALDIRRRLLATEVPMSRDPSPRKQRPGQPIVRYVQTYKPQLVLPDKLARASHAEYGIIDLQDESEHCVPDLLRSIEVSGSLTAIKATMPMLSLYSTVKVTNIPWDASMEQIVEFLGKNTRLAPYTSQCSPVHFVLDRTSGKTQSDIYIELVSATDAARFAQRKSGKNLGSRIVTVELVSSKEMLETLFPRWRPGLWLTAEEIQNVLTHAKTFKSPYTRKCPQRPFENFISILALFPWANKAAYAHSQVEMLYKGYVSIVSILQWHIRKGKIPQLDHSLLRRLVTAGTHLTAFSMQQKKVVCSVAGIYPESTAPNEQSVETPEHPFLKTAMPVGNATTCIKSTMSSIGIESREPVLSIGKEMTSQSSDQVSGEILLNETARTKAMTLRDLKIPELKVLSWNDTTITMPSMPKSAGLTKENKSLNPPAPCLAQLRNKLPLSGESLREKWLENARRAGIAVGECTNSALPR